MSQNRPPIHTLQRITRTMNLRITRPKNLLMHERRRESIRRSARMVRTSIPTRTCKRRDARVLSDDETEVGSESGVGVVRVDDGFVGWGVACHVLV